ncbi:class I SAM-dependent methyltransferase [Haloplanus pelagicus]|jgi:SAM-dependent methyltransferase|uniref:class I SAM-dependent methyltransferase n=1 Tax=Haloplanus pelagicus TaxID=2949995 RepID=UPI00203B3A07|nr:class I SAM-dependent methyltransferase [Haloplanus sp. HW8-1]
MDRDDLRSRIADQFSYRGQRADIWRGFDLVLDTDAFLNLGYSPWYLPHVVGSSQSRLADEVGTRLAAALPTTDGVRLLDVGCGRGGPTDHLADRYGVDAVGVDLVPYNVRRAARRPADASFVVGDATRLPFVAGTFPACTAIDALVYVPDRAAAFGELARVLEPGGVLVCSDLVAAPTLDDAERRTVDAFADAWDMPSLATVDAYERAVDGAGLAVRTVEDLTAHSVGRFRRWTALYLRLASAFGGRPLAACLRRVGLDPAAVTEQIHRAHAALPHLRHVVVVAERPAAR